MEEKFTPDIDWMIENYNRMNRELFGGALGFCSFNIMRKGSRLLGSFSCQGRIMISKTYRKMFALQANGTFDEIDSNNFVPLFKPMISLNGNYKATNESWLNALVHEMCHYYTYMNGIAPVQAHGNEFKEAARVVSERSHGRFTITRVASGEEAKQYELDPAIANQKVLLLKQKLHDRFIILISLKGRGYRLVITNSCPLIKEIISCEKAKSKKITDEIVVIRDFTLSKKLYDMGYQTTVKTYRFWTLSQDKGNAILDDEQTYEYIEFYEIPD